MHAYALPWPWARAALGPRSCSTGNRMNHAGGATPLNFRVRAGEQVLVMALVPVLDAGLDQGYQKVTAKPQKYL